jgi:hypothetical protein
MNPLALRKKRYGAMALAAALAVGCSGLPSVPEWVTKTPTQDARYTYFIGSSSADDSATALNEARASLVVGIVQYMGLSISITSSAEARASLDEYQAQVTQTVRTESKGRLAGFEVVEKYIRKDAKTGRYTVHILARYETEELIREKARIEALLQESLDAVAAPEARGDAAAAEGRLFDAIRAYAEAMSAAGLSEIENAQIKLERNAKKASAIAATLRLTTASEQGPMSIELGRHLPPLAARVVTNRGGKEDGVPGVPLTITYPRRLASGRLGTATARVFTDEGGSARFEVPPVDVVGDYRVTLQLDFVSISDLLESLPPRALPYIDALEKELSSIVLYFRYRVISGAKDIPTAEG